VRIQSAFTGYVGGIGAITRLIGARLHPMRGPDASFDEPKPTPSYVVYRFSYVRSRDTWTLSSSDSLSTGRLSLEIYSPAYDNAWRITEAFENALLPDEPTKTANFSGADIAEGLNIQSCRLESTRDDDSSRVGLFCVVSDYTIVWSKTPTTC